MGYYITPPASYHEGDAQYGDIVVPQRPDSTYDWSGSDWVQNAARKADVDEGLRLIAEKAAAQQIPELVLLLNATPAQIDAWFAANVTTVASARAALIILAKAVAILGRREFK